MRAPITPANLRQATEDAIGINDRKRRLAKEQETRDYVEKSQAESAALLQDLDAAEQRMAASGPLLGIPKPRGQAEESDRRVPGYTRAFPTPQDANVEAAFDSYEPLGGDDGVGGPQEGGLTDADIIELRDYQTRKAETSRQTQTRALLLEPGAPPDQAAKDQELADRAGVQPIEVEQDRETFTTNDAAKRIDGLSQSAPKLRSWLDDPRNFAVAHDDTDNLEWWEQAGKAVGDFFNPGSVSGAEAGQALQVGTDRAYQGVLGLGELGNQINKAMFGWLPYQTELNEAGEEAFRAERQRVAFNALRNTPEGDTLLESGIYDALTSAPASVGALLTAIATKSPALGAITMGEVTAGQSYGEAEDAGLPFWQRIRYAATQGGIEAATEFIPLKFLVGDMAKNSGFGKTLAKNLVAENVGEQIATFTQDMSTWLELHPEGTLGEFLAERPNAAMRTAIATTLMSGAQVSIASAVNTAGEKLQQNQIDERGKALEKTFTAMADNAKDSKLLKRLPERYRDAVTQATKDGPLQDVRIQSEAIVELAQTNNITTDQIAQAFRIDPADMNAAITAGGDVVIPTANYATAMGPQTKKELGIDGSAIHTALAPSMRLRADDFTAKEREAMKSVFEAEAKARADQATTTQTFADSADRVREAIREQVSNAKLFNVETASNQAAIAGEMVVTLAERTGQDPEKLWNDLGFDVVTALKGGEGELAQGGDREALSVDDETLSRASESLTEYAFLVWKAATIEGRSNKEIADDIDIAEARAKAGRGDRDTMPGPEGISVILSQAKAKGLPVSQAKRGRGDSIRDKIEVMVDQGFTSAQIHERLGRPQELRGSTNAMVSKVKKARRDVLQQGDMRGSFSPRADRSIIRLFESSNLSTFVHESSHWYLDTLWKMAYPSGTGTLAQSAQRAVVQIDPDTIIEASKKLQPREFEAWKMATLHGMGNEDIAVAMGGEEAEVSAEAVRTYLSRAREKGYPVQKISSGAKTPRKPGSETRQIIEMAAAGKSNADIAAEVYPDREAAKAVNQVKQIKFQQKDKIEQRKAQLEGALAQGVLTPEEIAFLLNAGQSVEQEEMRGSFSPGGAGGAQGTVHPFVQEQLAAILEWKGKSPNWTAMFDAEGRITAEGRELHESFAETFEAYLREGKAPSTSLRSVFATFKAWLMRIYRSVSQIGSRVNLNDEIREVFDRALASDEAIKAARSGMERDSEQMAKALLDKGVITEKAFERTKARLQAAREQAEADLMARLMEDYERSQQAWWRSEERQVRAEVASDIDARPEQRAYQWLSGGGWRGTQAESVNAAAAEAEAMSSLLQADGFLDNTKYYEPNATDESLAALRQRMMDDGVLPVILLFKTDAGRIIAFPGGEDGYHHDLARVVFALGDLKLEHGVYNPKKWPQLADMDKAGVHAWYATSGTVADAKPTPATEGLLVYRGSAEDEIGEVEKGRLGNGLYSAEEPWIGAEWGGQTGKVDAYRINGRLFDLDEETSRGLENYEKPEDTAEAKALFARLKAEGYVGVRDPWSGHINVFDAKDMVRQPDADQELGSTWTNEDAFAQLNPRSFRGLKTAAASELDEWYDAAVNEESAEATLLYIDFEQGSGDEKIKIFLDPAEEDGGKFNGYSVEMEFEGSISASGDSSPESARAAQVVFAKTVAALKVFVRRRKPEFLAFTGSGKEQEKLYDYMVRNMDFEGYEGRISRSTTAQIRGPVEVYPPSGKKAFTLVRPDIATQFPLELNSPTVDYDARSRTTQKGYRYEEVIRPSVRAERSADQGRDQSGQADAGGNELAQTGGKGPLAPPPPNLPPMRLDLEAMQETYGLEAVNKLPPQVRAYSEATQQADGLASVDPDVAAQFFNMRNGDELLNGLRQGPMRDRLIRAETKKRMTARHGDPFRDGSIMKEAETFARNEIQQRQYEIELEALSKAAGQQFASNLARETARENLRSKQVREVLNYNQWLQLEQKWGREALKHASKGSPEGYAKAAEAKRFQLVNLHMFREGAKLAESIEKTRKFMLTFEKKAKRDRLERAGADYLEQIDQILEGYEFRPRTGKELKARESLREWFARKEAENNPLADPQSGLSPEERIIAQEEAIARSSALEALQEEAQLRNYKSLTVEELLAVRDQSEMIWRMARIVDELVLEQERRSLALAAGDIAKSIETEQPKARKPAPLESDLPGEKTKRAISGYLEGHRTLQSLAREFDGGKDGGLFWRYIVKPLNTAFARLSTMRGKASEDITELFSVYTDREIRNFSRGKKFIPEINNTLTHQGRVAVALNWGTEKGRRRVMDSEGWSEAQVRAILNTLDQRDWTFIQKVWAHLDSYFAEANAVHETVHGFSMAKEEGVPVVTRFGIIPGNYYPIKFDSARSAKSDQRALEADAKIQAGRVGTRSREGFTKARSKGRVTIPLRLSVFDVITQHIDEVITSIATEKAMLDVGRLIVRPEMQAAIVERHGMQKYRAIVGSLREAKNGQEMVRNDWERFLVHIRNGQTIVGLGLNLMTAALQPLGLTNSIVRVGGYWMLRGQMKSGITAVNRENAIKFILDRSEFMVNREKSQSRELADLRNKLKRKRTPDWIEASYFYFITRTQFLVVDAPTWRGMYDKALHYGATEEDAIAQADQAVVDAQGTGEVHGLAGVQRGSPLWRLFTNFLSFMTTVFNLSAQRISNARVRGPLGAISLAVDMLLLWAAPVAGAMFLRAWLQGDGGDEDEDLWARYAKEQIRFLIGPFAIVNQLGGALGGFGYRGPQGLAAVAEGSNAVAAASTGDVFDESFWRPANKTAGAIFHYPAGQLDRTARGLMQLQSGETEDLSVILFGPKR